MEKIICYIKGCGDDITAKVQSERTRTISVLQYHTESNGWKVTVRCNNGHWNTVEGYGILIDSI